MHCAKSFSVLSPRKALPGTQGADVFSLRYSDWAGITLQLSNFIFLEGSGKTMDFHVRLVGEKLGRSLANRL